MRESALKEVDHERHVIALVVGRHDDAELGRRRHAGIARGGILGEFRALGQLIHRRPAYDTGTARRAETTSVRRERAIVQDAEGSREIIDAARQRSAPARCA